MGQPTRSVEGHQPTEGHSGASTWRALAPGYARWMRQASERMKTEPTTRKTAPDLSPGPVVAFKLIVESAPFFLSHAAPRGST